MPAQVIGATKSLDASSHVPEEEWYVASGDWSNLLKHCRAWNGKRDLMCVDVFSYSQRIRKTFERAGYKAMAYDIKSDPGFDITTKGGFMRLLDMGMSILSFLAVHALYVSLCFYMFLSLLIASPLLITCNRNNSHAVSNMQGCHKIE